MRLALQTVGVQFKLAQIQLDSRPTLRTKQTLHSAISATGSIVTRSQESTRARRKVELVLDFAILGWLHIITLTMVEVQ